MCYFNKLQVGKQCVRMEKYSPQGACAAFLCIILMFFSLSFWGVIQLLIRRNVLNFIRVTGGGGKRTHGKTSNKFPICWGWHYKLCVALIHDDYKELQRMYTWNAPGSNLSWRKRKLAISRLDLARCWRKLPLSLVSQQWSSPSRHQASE